MCIRDSIRSCPHDQVLPVVQLKRGIEEVQGRALVSLAQQSLLGVVILIQRVGTAIQPQVQIARGADDVFTGNAVGRVGVGIALKQLVKISHKGTAVNGQCRVVAFKRKRAAAGHVQRSTGADGDLAANLRQTAAQRGGAVRHGDAAGVVDVVAFGGGVVGECVGAGEGDGGVGGIVDSAALLSSMVTGEGRISDGQRGTLTMDGAPAFTSAIIEELTADRGIDRFVA